MVTEYPLIKDENLFKEQNGVLLVSNLETKPEITIHRVKGEQRRFLYRLITAYISGDLFIHQSELPHDLKYMLMGLPDMVGNRQTKGNFRRLLVYLIDLYNENYLSEFQGFKKDYYDYLIYQHLFNERKAILDGVKDGNTTNALLEYPPIQYEGFDNDFECFRPKKLSIILYALLRHRYDGNSDILNDFDVNAYINLLKGKITTTDELIRFLRQSDFFFKNESILFTNTNTTNTNLEIVFEKQPVEPFQRGSYVEFLKKTKLSDDQLKQFAAFRELCKSYEIKIKDTREYKTKEKAEEIKTKISKARKTLIDKIGELPDPEPEDETEDETVSRGTVKNNANEIKDKISKARNKLNVLKSNAATKIQAAYRGHRARSNFKQQKAANEEANEAAANEAAANEAATKIRATVRGRQARAKAEKQKAANEEANEAAATKIQVTVRGRQSRAKAEKQKAEKQKADKAATTIQATFRGRQARDQNEQQKQTQKADKAATTGKRIQRATKFKKDIEDMKKKVELTKRSIELKNEIGNQKRKVVDVAVTRIQTLARKNLKQKKYENVRKGVREIQAAYRGQQARSEFKQLKAANEAANEAAIRIQSMFRGLVGSRDYNKAKQSAETIQRIFRGRQARDQNEQQKIAVTKLQAAARGRQARAKAEKQKEEEAEAAKSEAATTVQAAFRGQKARRDLPGVKKEQLKVQIDELYKIVQKLTTVCETIKTFHMTEESERTLLIRNVNEKIRKYTDLIDESILETKGQIYQEIKQSLLKLSDEIDLFTKEINEIDTTVCYNFNSFMENNKDAVQNLQRIISGLNERPDSEDQLLDDYSDIRDKIFDPLKRLEKQSIDDAKIRELKDKRYELLELSRTTNLKVVELERQIEGIDADNGAILATIKEHIIQSVQLSKTLEEDKLTKITIWSSKSNSVFDGLTEGVSRNLGETEKKQLKTFMGKIQPLVDPVYKKIKTPRRYIDLLNQLKSEFTTTIGIVGIITHISTYIFRTINGIFSKENIMLLYLVCQIIRVLLILSNHIEVIFSLMLQDGDEIPIPDISFLFIGEETGLLSLKDLFIKQINKERCTVIIGKTASKLDTMVEALKETLTNYRDYIKLCTTYKSFEIGIPSYISQIGETMNSLQKNDPRLSTIRAIKPEEITLVDFESFNTSTYLNLLLWCDYRKEQSNFDLFNGINELSLEEPVKRALAAAVSLLKVNAKIHLPVPIGIDKLNDLKKIFSLLFAKAILTKDIITIQILDAHLKSCYSELNTENTKSSLLDLCLEDKKRCLFMFAELIDKNNRSIPHLFNQLNPPDFNATTMIKGLIGFAMICSQEDYQSPNYQEIQEGIESLNEGRGLSTMSSPEKAATQNFIINSLVRTMVSKLSGLNTLYVSKFLGSFDGKGVIYIPISICNSIIGLFSRSTEVTGGGPSKQVIDIDFHKLLRHSRYPRIHYQPKKGGYIQSKKSNKLIGGFPSQEYLKLLIT